MASDNNEVNDWTNDEDKDVTMAQATLQLPLSVITDTTEQDAVSAEIDSTMTDGMSVEGAVAWQPTAEEIAATAAWEQAQDDAQPNVSQFTQEQLLQQLLDHEMALQFDALENGAGYTISLPWNDVGMPPETFDCACGDTFNHAQLAGGEAIMLPCAHARCKDCLNENVRVGLSSRMNYPPKCCGPIDVTEIFDYLDEDVRASWLEKREEYDDVAPVYCAVKECSVYLNKDQLVEEGKWALCTGCNVKTCTGCLCLQSAHQVGSSECPERIDKMDKDLMVKKGWKSCPRCGNMIERTDGCDHMVCDCGQEFCYSCGRLIAGAIPCNCAGQRQWVNEDDEDNDPQAQQQIMDAINRARIGEIDDDDIDSEINDEIEGEMDEDSNDEEEVVSGDEGNEEVSEEAEDDQGMVESNAQEEMPETPSTFLRTALRTLHATEPELAVRMDLLSQVQARPYTLPGFAADVRRVREMNGEAFSTEMRNLERATGDTRTSRTNLQEQVIAMAEHW